MYAVAYAADKYDIIGLLQKCQERMRTTIKTDTVLSTLEQSILQTDNLTKDACLDYIYYHTREVFSIPEFLTITLRSLTEIMKKHRLNMKEEDIFEYLIKWSEAECARRQLTQNNNNYRLVLAAPIRRAIQFRNFSPENFQNQIINGRQGFLIAKEQNEIWNFVTSTKTLPPIPEYPERLIFMRFQGEMSGKGYTRGNEDAISFQISKDVILNYILIFGTCQHAGMYEMKISIVRDSNNTVVYQKEKVQKETDGHVKLHQVPVQPELIPIEVQANLNKDTRYTLFVKFRGPASYYGIEGREQLNYEDTLITFYTNMMGLNGTTVRTGQFPGFLFSKR